MSLQVLGPSVLGREDGAQLLEHDPVVHCREIIGTAQPATSLFNPGHELVPRRRENLLRGVVARFNTPQTEVLALPQKHLHLIHV
jgi:hypothetical protein